MPKQYREPDEIPDQRIREAFAAAKTIDFSARAFNGIRDRKVAFGAFGWWLPLRRVLPLIGIKPQRLRTVFSPQYKRVRGRYRPVALPTRVTTYEALGIFPLSELRFVKLAKVLGKRVRVCREDGYTGDHTHLFTALPSGKILQPKKA